MKSVEVVVMETKVRGVGRRTRYEAVPDHTHLAKLLRLGFAARLWNDAPRGGEAGWKLGVPEEQGEAAKVALSGVMCFASDEAKAKFEAIEAAKGAAEVEVETNRVWKREFAYYADVGSMKVASDGGISAPDGIEIIGDGGAVLLSNGVGDGRYSVRLVSVHELSKRFSHHEVHGDRAPELVAKALGNCRVFGYDCGEDVVAELSAAEINIYRASGHFYIVGVDLQVKDGS